jgi:hypothetical protein
VTTQELNVRLQSGSKVYGDPKSEVPFGVIDPQQRGFGSVPLVPAETIRELLRNGVLASNTGTGERYFNLAD